MIPSAKALPNDEDAQDTKAEMFGSSSIAIPAAYSFGMTPGGNVGGANGFLAGLAPAITSAVSLILSATRCRMLGEATAGSCCFFFGPEPGRAPPHAINASAQAQSGRQGDHPSGPQSNRGAAECHRGAGHRGGFAAFAHPSRELHSAQTALLIDAR